MSDTTLHIIPHLDPHLILPLLEFQLMKKTYKQEDIRKAKLEVAQKTSMIDFIVSAHKSVNNTEEIPAELSARKKAVVTQLKELQASCDPILVVLKDEKLVNDLRNDKNFTAEYLLEKHKVTADVLEALFKFAKLQYEIGNYQQSANYLSVYRQLSTNTEHSFQALWGLFGSLILLQKWEEAFRDFKELQAAIDTKNFGSPLKQLQQRNWLIHWSLFLFFNFNRSDFIEYFFNEKYLNAVQTTCPHMLRYLAASIITSKKRRPELKELVKIIQQESYTYRDPVTEFVEALFVSYDFELAQTKLRECDQVLSNDFFLLGIKDEFIENARLFIFETYCRIHQKIDINMLAQKLNMNSDAAEKWIVNLIRNAKLDAKIDSQNNSIIMGTQYPMVYQQVIETTKDIARATPLAPTAQKFYNQNNQNQNNANREDRHNNRGAQDHQSLASSTTSVSTTSSVSTQN